MKKTVSINVLRTETRRVTVQVEVEENASEDDIHEYATMAAYDIDFYADGKLVDTDYTVEQDEE